MKVFIQPGEAIDLTATEAISSGDIVVVNDLVGVAQTDAATGDLFAVAVQGVYNLPKVGGLAISVGDKVYVGATGGSVNKTGTDTYVGKAVTAAATSDTAVHVRLDQ